MKKLAVFVGINNEGSVMAAIQSESMGSAKSMLPGLEVIKMTSFTKIFVTNAKYPHKKFVLSGETVLPKLRSKYPVSRVLVSGSIIEFFSAVYFNDMALQESTRFRFPTIPGEPTGYVVCK